MKNEPLLNSVELLANSLGRPVTSEEFDGGWSAGGKKHWLGIVQQWQEALLSNQVPAWAPVNGKHLDNSGGGTSGELADQLERVGKLVWLHYKSKPLLRRLAARITSASSRRANARGLS